ncbi:10722_t:CDS:2 [Gigaspora margarita]|uniref:10722_t:CDS:1 n=1 Tax=Gigaspora margarita TaxID=4874 RepID=A0ABN7VKL2_GIGMA|nr:10722_t:CDS:2 [Gigaspora margarita]
MTTVFLKDLANDLGYILENCTNQDVIIQAGQGNDMKEFKAHSVILSARCPYFRATICSNWTHKEGDLLQILIAAEELWLQKLINYIQNYLIEKKSCFLRTFAAHVLETILHLESCTTLQNYCLEVICEHSYMLFGTQKYLWLDKSVLFLILSCDDLGIKEIDIWKYLILWGISRIKYKGKSIKIDIMTGEIIPLKNLSNLSSEMIFELKSILDQFIPLIRWFDIPSNEFFQDVYPFEKILPKSFFQDILRYHMNSMNSPTFNSNLSLNRSMQNLPLLDSIIIDQNHVNVIASWIDKKDFNYYENKRAFTPINFEQGFPMRSNDSWLYTTDSFIFSFKNQQQINANNVNIARVADKHKAIYYNSNFGPGWGGGIDLIFVNNQARSNGFKTYPGIRSFINAINKIDDYEVFQITKI